MLHLPLSLPLGSDGTINFWDKDARCRLKGYPAVGGSISASAFNRDGTIFSYAVSYDWHKGYATNNPQYPNKVMLHPVNEEEVKPKRQASKRETKTAVKTEEDEGKAPAARRRSTWARK